MVYSILLVVFLLVVFVFLFETFVYLFFLNFFFFWFLALCYISSLNNYNEHLFTSNLFMCVFFLCFLVWHRFSFWLIQFYSINTLLFLKFNDKNCLNSHNYELQFSVTSWNDFALTAVVTSFFFFAFSFSFLFHLLLHTFFDKTDYIWLQDRRIFI